MNPPGGETGPGLADLLANPDEEALRRRRRFQLQRHSSFLLRDLRRKDRKGEDSPYRVETCMWGRARNCSGVIANKTTEGAGYKSGLQRCGSIWHCPVCAARISNERRRDIKAAVDAAAALGYKALLLTLTARHNLLTDLKDQLAAMTRAYAAVWRGAPSDRLKARYEILGSIRSLETTHSKRNGWHPHIHVILFVAVDADIPGLARDLRARWESMAARHGLTMNDHGFDLVDNTQKIADYIAKYGHEPKWTEADELARWHTKTGRKRGASEHLTPWQLLEYSYDGDAEAGELFREYAQVFHGRRQIVWSDGLRGVLGLEKELSDEEAAEKQMDAPELLTVYFSWDQWKIIRGNDARAEVLEVISRHDAAGIVEQCLLMFGFAPLVTEVAIGAESEMIDTDEV